jgi:hypothetical protein
MRLRNTGYHDAIIFVVMRLLDFNFIYLQSSTQYMLFLPPFVKLGFSRKHFAKTFYEKETKFRENRDTFRKSFRFREK